MTNAYKGFSTRSTPQSEPIPGSSQVKNNAGGYVFQVDDWKRLDRFLILGSEGATYYASERTMTKDNAEAVLRCIAADGPRTVARILEISDAGRAPKNDPALFALALCVSFGNPETRKLAYGVVPSVARIGTHLFHFVTYAEQFRGWGRGLRTAVANWYNLKSSDDIAYQVVKYGQRDGWSHHDVLHKAHAKPPTALHNAVYKFAKDGTLGEYPPRVLEGYMRLQKAADAAEAALIIADYKLPRECVPTQFLTDSLIWEALLPHMGLTAMIRNLATMTRVGLIGPLSKANAFVISQITDQEKLTKSRVHPIQMLSALKTYAQGHGEKSTNTWNPVQQIVDALDAGFYAAFGNVTPSGVPIVKGIDISGSMDGGVIAGVPGLTPRLGAAAMALVTARVEPNYHLLGFTSDSSGGYWSSRGATDVDKAVTEIKISPKMRLDDVIRVMSNLAMGGTDCSVPVRWAEKHKVPAEAFFVYTDNETWAGKEHVTQVLKRYRNTVPNARLATIAFTATEFTIADPNDPGMLDVVGFDTATPNLLSDFAKGNL